MTYHFLTLYNSKHQIYRSFGLLFLFISLAVFQPVSISAQSSLNKIVIDAGHGGKDPGASGKYSREKDVVLSIALKTGQLLKKKYPNIEIIYTRKTDVFIPLKERAEIANKNKADLFISIHCNSNTSSQPHGAETYVMGLHKSEANLNVAKKENSAMLFEADYQQQYDGFNPTSDESHIIFNFFQNSFSSQNLDLASKIQTEFTVDTPLKNRGVKQAGFWVLYKTTMPGVLIETGFLSNVKDEKFLNSKNGQLQLSKAIVKAVGDYKDAHDANEKNKLVQIKNKGTEKEKEIIPTKTENKLAENKTNEDITIIKTESPRVAKEQKKPQTVAKTEEHKKANLPIFKIQFLSLNSQKKLSGAKYDKLPIINSYKYKGLYRYTSGETQEYKTAILLQNKVRKAGFKDAFIVAFLNGKRMSLKDARAMLE